MNSCHLNQYFNSKANHSPLDKIPGCHFLLLFRLMFVGGLWIDVYTGDEFGMNCK